MNRTYATLSADNSSPHFLTTCWEVVEKAAGESVHSREAFSSLCKLYWFPLYVYHRRYIREIVSTRDSEDVVQSFFLWLMESKVLERADSQRGRFRTFLLASFKQFLSRQHHYEAALKRNPALPMISLNEFSSRCKSIPEPSHDLTADRLYDYVWALELVERSLERLKKEWEDAGRLDRFLALQLYMVGDSPIKTDSIAHMLNISEGAVRIAVYRMRQRFAEIVREEVRSTGPIGLDINSEICHLMQVLKG